MIEVDGYKAFHGTLHIFPDGPRRSPFDITGDCLYKPETDRWYVQPANSEHGFSQSYPADICKPQEDAWTQLYIASPTNRELVYLALLGAGYPVHQREQKIGNKTVIYLEYMKER